MEQPLIAPAFRRPALFVAVLGFAVFFSLAVLIFHAKRTAFDSWAFRVLPERISSAPAQFMIGFTDPAVSVLLLVLTVVLAWSVRRLDIVILAVVGPIVGTILVSDVAKPIVHRTLFGGTTGTYPSGHQTGVTCTATVLLIAFGLLPLRRPVKYALAVVLAVWVIIAAVALTRFYYHYATDTIGSMGLSVALVLGLAGLLDRYWPSRGGASRRPPRQARAAPSRSPRPVRPRPSRRPRPVPADESGTQLTPRA
ncbi:hypothetical protein [uncultured Jatrophihabitans sp.]|uniref:hypothetical protein n=1 Tax=uncultured Jatrophihabitans sp. TaxID=1610747 RepID=UPI0035CB3EC5